MENPSEQWGVGGWSSGREFERTEVPLPGDSQSDSIPDCVLRQPPREGVRVEAGPVEES